MMRRFRELPLRSVSFMLLRILGIFAISCCLESRFASGKVFSSTLKTGQALLASNNDVLISANGRFAVGFFPDVSNKSFYFGCWFTDEVSYRNISKVVWVSDPRPGPIASNARWDALGRFAVYTTATRSTFTATFRTVKSTRALLRDDGNLVFYDDDNAAHPSAEVFQSFGEPFDTLLPGQIFRPDQMLYAFSSSEFLPTRPGVNPTPGPYHLNFQADGNLGLYQAQTNYWLSNTPNVQQRSLETNYAVLDPQGLFNVNNKSLTSDASGVHLPLVRRLTLDPDGNLRLYAQSAQGAWSPVWSAVADEECIPRNNFIPKNCRNGMIIEPPSTGSTNPSAESKTVTSSNMLLIIVSSASILGTVVVLLVLFLCWCVLRRRRTIVKLDPSKEDPSKEDSLESKHLSSGFMKVVVTNSVFEDPRSFKFEEVEAATRSFRKLLGSGAFGKVYKGKLPDDRLIAVKTLEKSQQGCHQFQTEVLAICRVAHPNLVRLHGFCSDATHQMLVYEFVANRSLERFLFGRQKRLLDWPTRLQIAVGAARALRACHENRIIHCDVKPENLLLDANLAVKVSDFGLAKIMGVDKSWTRTHLRGTCGYLAPEWISGRPVSVKVDVYSFGVVLLELVTGKRSRGEVDLLEWVYDEVRAGRVAQVVDRRLREYDEKGVLLAIRCGLWCVQVREQVRPNMHAVVEMLEGTREVPVPPPPREAGEVLEEDEVSSCSVPRQELKQR